MVEVIDLVLHSWALLEDIILGGMGGCTVYLFDYLKAKREGDEDFVFRISSMLINVVLGMFVSYAISGLLSPDNAYRHGILLLSGFSAYNILTLAESRFAEFVFNKILGGKK